MNLDIDSSVQYTARLTTKGNRALELFGMTEVEVHEIMRFHGIEIKEDEDPFSKIFKICEHEFP